MEPGISDKGSIIIQLAVFTDCRHLGVGEIMRIQYRWNGDNHNLLKGTHYLFVSDTVI